MLMASRNPARPRASSPGSTPHSFYLYIAPVTLLFLAVITWIAPTNFTFILSSLVGTIVGLFVLWDVFLSRGTVRISRILGTSLLIGYAAGVTNTWATLPRDSNTLAQYFYLDQGTLSRGIASVLAAVAVVFAIGEITEPPIEAGISFPISDTYRLKISRFIYVSTVLIAIAFLHGDIGYMGVSSGSDQSVTVLGVLASWLFPPAYGLTLVAVTGSLGRYRRLPMTVLFAIQTILLVPLGRRPVMTTFAVAALAYRLLVPARPSFSIKKVAAVLLAIFAIGVCSIAFMYLRVATYTMSQDQRYTLASLVEAAIVIHETQGLSDILDTSEQNIETRTFLIGFYADLLERSGSNPVGLGENLLHQASSAVPSLFWAGKHGSAISEEDYAAQLFRTWYPDQSNSVMTAGAVDFGLLGALLYPVALSGLVSGGLVLLSKVTRSPIPLIATLSTVYVLLNTEADLAAYFVQLRNSLLFVILLVFTFSLPVIKFRRTSTADMLKT